MNSFNYSELKQGSFVINESNIEQNIGQIYSSINNMLTINFENVGKQVINIKEINLELIKLK